MNRKEFMKVLRGQLSKLQEEEREEILWDYEEHFEEGLSKGRSEHDLAKSLGDPKSIAKQIMADHHIRHAESNKNFKNIMRAIFASAGLGFFNLVFVLAPFIGVLAVLFTLFVLSLVVVVLGFAAIMLLFVPQFTAPALTSLGYVFIGIGTIALGVLFFIGNCYLTKWLYIVTIMYLKWNVKIIRGERD